jgi:flagellar biosynthesis component FlhA
MIAAGFAVVTAWAGHGMTLTLPGAIGAYAGLVLLAIGAHMWHRREWRAHERQRKQEEEEREERLRKEREAERQERREADAKAHEAYLSESVPCEGFVCVDRKATFPRNRLWRLGPGYGGKAVCRECFKTHTRQYPVEGKDKRAFT